MSRNQVKMCKRLSHYRCLLSSFSFPLPLKCEGVWLEKVGSDDGERQVGSEVGDVCDADDGTARQDDDEAYVESEASRCGRSVEGRNLQKQV